MKCTIVAAATLSLAAAGLVVAGPVQHHTTGMQHDDGLAPIYTPPNPWSTRIDDDVDSIGIQSIPSPDAQDNIIPNSYIVVLKEEHGHRLPHLVRHLKDFISTSAIDSLSSSSSRKSKRGSKVVDSIKHHFDVGSLRGYAGRFTDETLDYIRRHPAVHFVERDSVVKAMDLEKNAPWGLARLSHRKALTLGTLGKYEYEHEGGKGVDVYVIDTGINVKHTEFDGRAKWGKTMPLNDVDEDGNGHGSHVAGTIGSNKYGVAKAANLIAVKVLGSGGSGSMSDVVGGVAWAASQAAAKVSSESAKNGTHKGSVANMSLGGGKSPALDMAVNNAVKKGLHFAVAAGNDNRDACSYSPASAELAITVGASTLSDSRAYFSNFGKCVDIFAPGLNILSTWNTGPTSVNTISGTSMATPHIAGLTAYFLSLYGSDFQPTQEDFAAAGVPFPGSAEEKELADKKAGLWGKGRQLVFGSFGRKNQLDNSLYKSLDPQVLKKAMIRLSTKNVLTQIPNDGTPNYLAFNNFTAPASASFIEEIVEEIEDEIVSFQPVFEKGEAMVVDAIDGIEEIMEKAFDSEVENWWKEK